MPQLLHLRNGEDIMNKIRSSDGRLSILMRDKKADEATVDELFLATLSRLPTPAQREKIKKTLAEDNRVETLRDLFWALINSKEFAFNH